MLLIIDDTLATFDGHVSIVQTVEGKMAAKLALCVFVSLVVAVVCQRPKYHHYRKDYHIIEFAVDLDTITFDKV